MREYTLVFTVAAAVTYLLTPIARRVALARGVLAQPRDRDVHAIPTPYLGGLAMYGGVAAALLVSRSLPTLGKIWDQSSEPRAILIAGALICLIGVLDDRYGLDALTKLAGQALSTGVMVLLGIQLLYLSLPGIGTVSLNDDVAVPATVLLALVMVNSINFIDGLDGLAAGVVAIAAGAFFVFCYQFSVVLQVQRAGPATLFSAVLAGVCVGFLPHNFHPARIFMGDSGSMLIGLMLAAAATSGTGQFAFDQLSGEDVAAYLTPLLVPVIVLVVPFIDLLLTIVRRMRSGRPLFAPDKEHLHHRLLELGHSQRRAVLIIYLWSGLIAFGGVAISFARPAIVISVVGVLAAYPIATLVLARLSRRPAQVITLPTGDAPDPPATPLPTDEARQA